MNLIELKRRLVEKKLCDRCLGRFYGKLGHNIDNTTRGRALRTVFSLIGLREFSVVSKKCELCSNLFGELEYFAKLIVKELSAWEFDTFLIGSRIDAEIVEKEEQLWSELNTQYSEPIKSEVNREVGKLVHAKIDKEVDFTNPDIVAVIDTRYDSVELQIAPLFIYGRYRKFLTGIPQTKWPCRMCLGKGCEHCGGKGKMYDTSVEELIAVELMKVTGGTTHFFHGMGREDIDVRMLGNGRPFILEIRNPRKRKIDLAKLEALINRTQTGKIEVERLRITNKNEIVQLKRAKFPKTYRVVVEFSSPVDNEKLKEVLRAFRGEEVQQQTPSRVAHRRAARARKRKILGLTIEASNDKSATLVLTTEAGTYIKELIHGDEGRTKPNLQALLGVNCKVKAMEVVRIHDE